METFIRGYFAILIALMPLYVVRLHLGGWYPTNVLEIMYGGFLIVSLAYFGKQGLNAAVQSLVGTTDYSQIRGYSFRWLLIAILGLLISGAVAVSMSPDRLSALGIYKAYFIEPIILFSLLTLLIPRLNLSRSLLIGAALLSFWMFGHALVQTIFQVGIYAPDEAILNRATTVFTTANAIGLLLGPLACIFAAYVMASKIPGERIIALLGLLSAISAILLSQSLSSIIALMISFCLMIVLFLFFFTKRFDRYIPLLATPFIVIPQLATVGFFQFVLPLITPNISPQEMTGDSVAIRFYLWQVTYKLLLSHPLGLGLSAFPSNFLPMIENANDLVKRSFSPIPLYPHNFVLNFGTEVGIIGLISFLFIMIFFLQRALRYRLSAIHLGVCGAICYFIIHGLSDVPYFKNDLAMLFWILGAFAVSAPVIAAQVEDRQLPMGKSSKRGRKAFSAKG